MDQTSQKACVINHRISLSADLANRLGIDYYKEAEPLSEKGVATCVNSMLDHNINSSLNLAPAVVVDEFSQTVEHLAIGPIEHRADF